MFNVYFIGSFLVVIAVGAPILWFMAKWKGRIEEQNKIAKQELHGDEIHNKKQADLDSDSDSIVDKQLLNNLKD